MTTLDNLAKDLHMKPEALLRESLETYLRHKLKVVESELFLLAKKYGAKTAADFDQLVEKGKFHEQDAFEDFFKFDNLEAERDSILKNLESL